MTYEELQSYEERIESMERDELSRLFVEAYDSGLDIPFEMLDRIAVSPPRVVESVYYDGGFKCYRGRTVFQVHGDMRMWAFEHFSCRYDDSYYTQPYEVEPRKVTVTEYVKKKIVKPIKRGNEDGQPN